MDSNARMDRRDFLRRTSVVGGALVTGPLALGQSRKGDVVSLVLDPADRVASAAPARWAAQELQQALPDAGFTVRRRESPGHWLALGRDGDIFIGSLTGNVFRWYPGWSTGLRENEPGVVAPR